MNMYIVEGLNFPFGWYPPPMVDVVSTVATVVILYNSEQVKVSKVHKPSLYRRTTRPSNIFIIAKLELSLWGVSVAFKQIC